MKSDQEPAIVDIQRSVIAKRGSAPTIPVNRVENAIKKVRNMAKTLLFKSGGEVGHQSDS